MAWYHSLLWNSAANRRKVLAVMKLKRPLLVALFFFFRIIGTALAQQADEHLNLSYVHIQTSREADRSKGLIGGDMAPDLVIRLFGSGKEVFAFSGAEGSVVVPLRPGYYCTQLFTRDGQLVKLTSHRSCFTVRKGEYLEVDIEAAFNPAIKVNPPPRKLP